MTLKEQKVTLVDVSIPEVNKNRLSNEPIGILQLGSYLKKKIGIDVSYAIVDSEEDITKIIENNPDIVGFSSYTYNYLSAYRLAQKIRKQNPDIKIVFGGAHAGSIPE